MANQFSLKIQSIRLCLSHSHSRLNPMQILSAQIFSRHFPINILEVIMFWICTFPFDNDTCIQCSIHIDVYIVWKGAKDRTVVWSSNCIECVCDHIHARTHMHTPLHERVSNERLNSEEFRVSLILVCRALLCVRVHASKNVQDTKKRQRHGETERGEMASNAKPATC